MKTFIENIEIKSAQKKQIFNLDNETLISLASNENFRDLMLSTNNIEKFGKYSILALNPIFVLEFKENTLFLNNLKNNLKLKEKVELKTALNYLFKPIKGSSNFEFQGFWTGFFNYNIARLIEKIELPQKEIFSYPDFSFVFSDTFIIKNHFENETYLILLDTNISTKSINSRKQDFFKEIKKANLSKSVISEKIEGNFVVKSNITKEK